MKKFAIIVLCIICMSLITSAYTNIRKYGGNIEVKTIYEDGHKYVIAYQYVNNMERPGGIDIEHSAACPCLKNK